MENKNPETDLHVTSLLEMVAEVRQFEIALISKYANIGDNDSELACLVAVQFSVDMGIAQKNLNAIHAVYG